MTELSLNRRDIAGFLDEVSAHGMAGVMGRVTRDASQVAHLVENRIDHPGIQPTVAMALVTGERNSAGDFQFLKSVALSLAT